MFSNYEIIYYIKGSYSRLQFDGLSGWGLFGVIAPCNFRFDFTRSLIYISSPAIGLIQVYLNSVRASILKGHIKLNLIYVTTRLNNNLVNFRSLTNAFHLSEATVKAHFIVSGRFSDKFLKGLNNMTNEYNWKTIVKTSLSFNAHSLIGTPVLTSNLLFIMTEISQITHPQHLINFIIQRVLS